MQISRQQFESELEGLINAAFGANSKETARRLLIEAENKISGYDNIPYDLQAKYLSQIDRARAQLGL